MTDMIGTAEAARLLGVPLSTVTNACRDGGIRGAIRVEQPEGQPGIRRKWMFPRAALDELQRDDKGRIIWRARDRVSWEAAQHAPVSVRTYTHWGNSGAYGPVPLPRNDADALRVYQRVMASASGRSSAVYGGHGVSLFCAPIRVWGIVRGLSESGDPTLYLIAEDSSEPSDAAGEEGGEADDAGTCPEG